MRPAPTLSLPTRDKGRAPPAPAAMRVPLQCPSPHSGSPKRHARFNPVCPPQAAPLKDPRTKPGSCRLAGVSRQPAAPSPSSGLRRSPGKEKRQFRPGEFTVRLGKKTRASREHWRTQRAGHRPALCGSTQSSGAERAAEARPGWAVRASTKRVRSKVALEERA